MLLWVFLFWVLWLVFFNNRNGHLDDGSGGRWAETAAAWGGGSYGSGNSSIVWTAVCVCVCVRFMLVVCVSVGGGGGLCLSVLLLFRGNDGKSRRG